MTPPSLGEGWLVDWLVGWLVGRLVGWLFGCLAGWLAGWLDSRFVGLLVFWLLGVLVYNDTASSSCPRMSNSFNNKFNPADLPDLSCLIEFFTSSTVTG